MRQRLAAVVHAIRATGGRLTWLPWLACTAAVLSPVAGVAQANLGELAVKATYLYKFPPFVEWPAGGLPAGENFTLCIVGDDPFGAMLDRAVEGQQVKDRPIVVRRLAIFNGDGGCQMVYATGSSAQPVPAILAALRGKPILSVTDGERDAKGMLNFVIADNRVRFEIDDKTAADSGFVISSKLLSLASHVRPRL
jgi:hypothetical protein